MAMFLAAVVMLAPIAAARLNPVEVQDNSHAAGQVIAGTLTVNLVIDSGLWRPNGNDAAPVEVRAFGEEGHPLSVPGPLIRAAQGTDVVVTVRNMLKDDVRVFGLCTRPAACPPVAVAAGHSQSVRFSSSTPGTYYYWASTSGSNLSSRRREDSQLGGALVVDPRGSAAADRVMVISTFEDGPAVGLCVGQKADAVFAINGASWPHTARLKYTTGEPIQWRVINLSCDQHAMHLHGFHFTVSAMGDGATDRPLAAAEQKTEVTESILPGRTFAMTWTPTRAGNWLFHCHMVPHMTTAGDAAHAMHDLATHAGMAGLVIGIEVADGAPASVVAVPAPAMPVRRVSLVLREEPNRYGNAPGFRMDIEGAEAPRLDAGPVPGPVLILRRGEPAEITVVNRMSEPTAIHWHGLEIESYYDGVPGFGGSHSNIAEPIAPDASFVVRVTPPRAGTFIYHTHWHDAAQLAGGLYGALLVLGPDEHYDPATDHVVVIGLNGPDRPNPDEPFALNGRAKPAPIELRAGVPNRLRLINITATNVALIASLADNADVVHWKPLAKDGASLPPEQSLPRRARQQVAVGETYDFEVTPGARQNLWLEVRRGTGEWVLQAPVLVR